MHNIYLAALILSLEVASEQKYWFRLFEVKTNLIVFTFYLFNEVIFILICW